LKQRAGLIMLASAAVDAMAASALGGETITYKTETARKLAPDFHDEKMRPWQGTGIRMWRVTCVAEA
jgi:hypothetical protein